MSAAAPRVCVYGIGSPFGPDRAGWLAIDALERSGLPERYPQVEFARLDRPGAALVARMAGADRVVLIDAVEGGQSGRLRRLSREQLASSATTSSHGFGVAEALALAGALGNLPSDVFIFGIETGEAESAEAFDYAGLVSAIERVLGT